MQIATFYWHIEYQYRFTSISLCLNGKWNREEVCSYHWVVHLHYGSTQMGFWFDLHRAMQYEGKWGTIMTKRGVGHDLSAARNGEFLEFAVVAYTILNFLDVKSLSLHGVGFSFDQQKPLFWSEWSPILFSKVQILDAYQGKKNFEIQDWTNLPLQAYRNSLFIECAEQSRYQGSSASKIFVKINQYVLFSPLQKLAFIGKMGLSLSIEWPNKMAKITITISQKQLITEIWMHTGST